MSTKRRNSKKKKHSNAGFHFCLVLIFFVVLIGSTGTLLWLNGFFSAEGTSSWSLFNNPAILQEEKVPMDRVFIVGDSITLGAEAELREKIPGAAVDGVVGRSAPTGLEILTDLKEDGIPLDYVVIGLANNVHQDEIKSFRAMLDLLSDEATRIVFVTGHGKADMKAGNEFIRTLPNLYDNVTVADWDEAISDHEEWLGGDGIHVYNKKANTLYADLVYDALIR
ncbi:MAG: hypothetical protein LBN34_01715 [Clostridiales Family XIII bacterium]|jgi:hypothetical protein|nr:hypothetical protein [Clostridiales Family XIII bacterium]